MENSDIDDDFTLDGKALHRNKKEKDLRKKEDLLAVLVIMVRVAMRLDDDDDDDDDVSFSWQLFSPPQTLYACV